MPMFKFVQNDINLQALPRKFFFVNWNLFKLIVFREEISVKRKLLPLIFVEFFFANLLLIWKKIDSVKVLSKFCWSVTSERKHDFFKMWNFISFSCGLWKKLKLFYIELRICSMDLLSELLKRSFVWESHFQT